MATIKMEKYFSHAQSKQLNKIIKKEMQKLMANKYKRHLLGKDISKYDEQISNLRHTQIALDIWKCETHIW